MANLNKKIFLSLLLIIPLILSLFIPSISANAIESGGAYVIASKCNLYSEAKFDSEKVTTLDDLEQPVLITLKFGEEVIITEIQDDFAKVSVRNVEGWVYKYYLSQSNSQDVYPVFNGTVRKDSVVYDVDKEPTEIIAKADSRIFIYKGFSKKELTAVQIVLDDGSLYTGYLTTADIEPDGVSKLLIVAITIIIAAVTIILSIIFIKKGRKKKDKKV